MDWKNEYKKNIEFFFKFFTIAIIGFFVTSVIDYFNSINFWECFAKTTSVVLIHFLIYVIIEGFDSKIVKWKYLIIYTVVLSVVLELFYVSFTF